MQKEDSLRRLGWHPPPASGHSHGYKRVPVRTRLSRCAFGSIPRFVVISLNIPDDLDLYCVRRSLRHYLRDENVLHHVRASNQGL